MSYKYGSTECDRNNCGSSGCSRYSDCHGYICYNCFEELVSLGPEASISDFMSSYKKELSSTEEEAAEARFNIEFPKEED